MRRRWTWALLAACAAGCASLADRIVEPRSEAAFPAATIHAFDPAIVEARARTPQGVDLAYRVVAAAQRGMHARVERGRHAMAFHFSFDHAATPRALPVRGTVVYLHGWGMDGSTMLPWAWALAERGYRGIAVDLRNFGDSSRAPAGFGPREAGDVAALFDILQARGQLQPPVYLFGVSYGASTALFAEPALRGRIAGIVAMEPYANAADGIRGLVRGMLASDDAGIGPQPFRAYARHAYTPARIDEAIAEAGRRLDLDLAKVDVHDAVAHAQTCTLLLHGAHDSFLPAAATRALAGLSPLQQYVELPVETHLSLPVRVDWLAAPLADWLANTGAHCGRFVLPADPALSR